MRILIFLFSIFIVTLMSVVAQDDTDTQNVKESKRIIFDFGINWPKGFYFSSSAQVDDNDKINTFSIGIYSGKKSVEVAHLPLAEYNYILQGLLRILREGKKIEVSGSCGRGYSWSELGKRYCYFLQEKEKKDLYEWYTLAENFIWMKKERGVASQNTTPR